MQGCSLGIDVGSVSTNLVLLDPCGEIIKKIYIHTSGRPIEVLCEGLAEIRDFMGRQCQGMPIGACGATGSGRRIVEVITGCDIVKNEITAQAAAAMRAIPDVRTILEIGGQDSKIIFVEDGAVIDFAMNTVCAAGTGSFLDRQAARLGIPIGEFGAHALRSSFPVRIAGRCAVFAESDMIHKQQAGHRTEDILSGLCEALVRNYLSNLARNRDIHEPVVFQGGVAANQGMVAAFEKLLNKKVTVPRHHDVMGAFGAALLAGEKTGGDKRLTKFKGFDSADKEYEVRTHECNNCSNNCEIADIMESNKLLARLGSRCGKS